MKTNCKEIKEFLNGECKEFNCHLLKLDHEIGILKYIIQENHLVDSVKLKPGDITYGIYWHDLPFNLYKWEDKGGRCKGNYFNVADNVKLTEEVFFWRDLILDILVLSENDKPVLIDENEIPKQLDRRVKEYIFSSKKYILQNYQDIVSETDKILDTIKMK